MEQEKTPILFALLRSAVRGEALTAQQSERCCAEEWDALLKTAHKHDLIHLVALGLKRNRLLSQENAGIEKYIFRAAYRYEKINREFEMLSGVLEDLHIPFLPLKGTVIRKYYPQPWMRTSCDIDILVHEEDTEKVVSALVNDHGYTHHSKNSHDFSLYSPSKVHLELHYKLVEDELAGAVAKVLQGVWDTASVREGCRFWHEMPEEMFYFYHIAHMAKHFANGGCGIRPFIDLWILDNMEGVSQEKRNALLTQGQLLTFAAAAQKLSRIWFENEEYDLISREMEDYILRGGVYGSGGNRVILQQQKKGGRLRYALSRIFLPYDVIKYHYPILQKHRWLLPLIQLYRWCKLIFRGHIPGAAKELQCNAAVTPEQAERMRMLLQNIGLSQY